MTTKKTKNKTTENILLWKYPPLLTEVDLTS